jgi:hypothetical protein
MSASTIDGRKQEAAVKNDHKIRHQHRSAAALFPATFSAVPSQAHRPLKVGIGDDRRRGRGRGLACARPHLFETFRRTKFGAEPNGVDSPARGNKVVQANGGREKIAAKIFVGAENERGLEAQACSKINQFAVGHRVTPGLPIAAIRSLPSPGALMLPRVTTSFHKLTLVFVVIDADNFCGDVFDGEPDACEIRDSTAAFLQVGADGRLHDVVGQVVNASGKFL